MSGDRHACGCSVCPCKGSSAALGGQCPSCARGYHRASEELQQHFREGLDYWIRTMPVTLGSSGLSDKQLRQAGEAWQSWHDKRPCPVPRQAPVPV